MAITRLEQQILTQKPPLTLYGIAEGSTLIWTMEEELKEMKGTGRGLIRSVRGREMLEAHKLAIAEEMKLKKS